MRLFYTGASKTGAAQNEPSKSIGGYVSSSMVPSGLNNSLFSDTSQTQMKDGKPEYVLVSLKNTTGADKTDTKIYYEQTNQSLYTIQMGLIEPALDKCGDPVYEKTTNNNAAPLGVTFTDNILLGGAINIPSLLIDAHMGVWIKRTINPAAYDTFTSCDNLLEAHLDPEHASAVKEFPFDVKIDYT